MLHLRIIGPSALLSEVAEAFERRQDARHVIVRGVRAAHAAVAESATLVVHRRLTGRHRVR